MTADIIETTYRTHVVQWTGPGWINATLVAQSFQKSLYEWLTQEETLQLVTRLLEDSPKHRNQFLIDLHAFQQLQARERLSASATCSRLREIFRATGLVKARIGPRRQRASSWLHPELGQVFVKWLDADFGQWCHQKIYARPLSLAPAAPPVPDRPADELDGEAEGNPLATRLNTLLGEFQAAKTFVSAFGVPEEQANEAANAIVKNEYGVDCLELVKANVPAAGVPPLSAPLFTAPQPNGQGEAPALISVSEVARRLGVHHERINPALEKLGFLRAVRLRNKRREWELTEAGKRYGKYCTSRRCTLQGMPRVRRKWRPEVVEVLRRWIMSQPNFT